LTGQLVNRELLNILVGHPSGDICYLWLTQQLNKRLFVLVVLKCMQKCSSTETMIRLKAFMLA
jgi:hypothetical protein